MPALPTTEHIRQLMQSRQYAGALDALRQLEHQGAASPDIIYGKGICLAALGRTTEAKAAIQQLKELGNVAMAQRLAQRMAEEDPMQLDAAIAPPPAYPRSQTEPSIMRYVVGAVAAVLLVVTGIAIGLNMQRQDAPSAEAAPATPDSPPASMPAPTKPVNAGAAPAATASLDLTGSWQSVDFVADVDDFQPGMRATQVELVLQFLKCRADGGMSHDSCVWGDGMITHNESGVRAQYYVKSIDGAIYLFYPWISGDVTMRGMKPKFYVLQKTS